MRQRYGMVPFIFAIFFALVSASSLQDAKTVSDFMRMERQHGENTRESLPADSTIGGNHRGYSNVKTSHRREPSIQAYGLPKRTVENNGFIERVDFERTSGLGGKVDEVNMPENKPGIQAYGLPRETAENNGFIERFGAINDREEKSGKFATVRRTRSSDSGSYKNDLMDLEGQEAKVFRPLFVYRQQVADRYRVKRRKNPIYGAYQYGVKWPRDSAQGYRKYY